MEPALRNVIGAVLLTETGEVDVEQLDQSLIHDIEEGHGAVLDAKVKKLDKVGQDWEVIFEVDGHEEGLRAGNVVSFAESNATGTSVANALMQNGTSPTANSKDRFILVR